MFVATQVFEVTQLLDFFYGVTWSTSRKNLFNWRDEQEGNYENKVKAFFNRPRFLRLASGLRRFRHRKRRTDEENSASAPDSRCRKGRAARQRTG